MREMKDSGIAWIGDIPARWNLLRLKTIISSRQGGDWGQDPQGNDNDIICLRIADFDFDKGRFQKKPIDEYTKRNYLSYKVSKIGLHNGDIIIEKSGGGEKTPVGRSVIFDMSITAMYANFSDKLTVDIQYALPYFIAYYWRAMYFNRVTLSYIKQTTGIQNLDLSLLLNKEKIAIPCLKDQQAIVTFLDTKCAEIDALFSDIQKQIEILEQYKRSVISEAVTRGLDSNVPMKDSGIAWVKQIPKHWSVIPSKYLFHNSDTRKYPGDEQLTASQRHGIITQREYMERENAKVVFATQGLDNWKHVKPNDFVISLRSFQGGLEMSETTGCITWHYVVLEASKPIYPPFYKWLFKSVQYINALQGTCNFIRDGQDLRFSNFSKVPLYEPPMVEQKAIADYLDAKCAEIDQTIAQKQEQLDTLADYKKSLIYEYVTGKKEVPVP